MASHGLRQRRAHRLLIAHIGHHAKGLRPQRRQGRIHIGLLAADDRDPGSCHRVVLGNAQVDACGAAKHHHMAARKIKLHIHEQHSSARNKAFWIFPAGVSGNSVRNTSWRGSL
jgi:hypothetical protein